jgi:hypothetical protein
MAVELHTIREVQVKEYLLSLAAPEEQQQEQVQQQEQQQEQVQQPKEQQEWLKQHQKQLELALAEYKKLKKAWDSDDPGKFRKLPAGKAFHYFCFEAPCCYAP